MDEVVYYHGTLAAYEALAEKNPDALYFITDKGMVFKGGVPVATTRSVYIGSCNTAGANQVKVCEVDQFPLDENGKPLVGTIIGVKFANTNSAAGPQLDVNGTGAVDIWYQSSVYTSTGAAGGYKNRYIYYVYDGTFWVYLSWDCDSNTTYALMSDAALKLGAETTGRTVSAKLLKDNFNIQGRTIIMRKDSIDVPEELEWEEL